MKDSVFKFDIEEFKIGKLTKKDIDFPSFYGLQKVKAPIFVYRASKEVSPCLVITACLHGDEINGLSGIQDLLQSELKITKGTLIILPVVNIYGFLNKLRYLPDRKDLNRCFPGSSKGSFGSRFAQFIFKTITKYGDVFIDLHSGGPGRFNIPQIRCDLHNQNILEMIKNISIPLVVNSSLRDGSLREAINDINKPCIVFEGGEGLRIDTTINKYIVNLIESTMKYLGMIESDFEYNLDKIIIKKTKWLRAKEGGLLYNSAQRGEVVKKGEEIGEIKSISGDLITKINMENDGVLLGMAKTSMIMAGDALYNVGYIDDDFPEEEDEMLDYFDLEM